MPFTFSHEWVTDGSGGLTITSFVDSGSTASATIPIVDSGIGWYVSEVQSGGNWWSSILMMTGSRMLPSARRAEHSLADSWFWKRVELSPTSRFSVIYFSDLLTANERQQLTSYLNNRYFPEVAEDLSGAIDTTTALAGDLQIQKLLVISNTTTALTVTFRPKNLCRALSTRPQP